MDTISFRINKGVRIRKDAPFVPQFERRDFNQLTSVEKTRSKNLNFRYFRKFRLHSESTDLYTPQVEVYEKANKKEDIIEYEMVVSLSFPKILFGNNLQEIEASDLNKIVSCIKNRLSTIGIEFSEETVLNAPVSVAHFSKNILLPPDLPIRTIFKKLSHVDVGKAYQTTEDTRTKDTNSSEIIHLRAGVREWSFYDKVNEMKQSKNKLNNELIETYSLEHVEIFRYEYRLNKAQTIRSEINKKLGRDYKVSVRVIDLFSDSLWKNILLDSWQRIIKKPENQLAFIEPINELNLFLHALENARERKNSGHGQNEALWSAGLALLIDKVGAKAVRHELGKVWSKKTLDRLDNKLDIALKLVKGIPLYEGISEIVQGLEEFKRIDLELLKDRKRGML